MELCSLKRKPSQIAAVFFDVGIPRQQLQLFAGRGCRQEQAGWLFACAKGRLTFGFFLGLMGWL
jgi:hypothetical protein